MPKPQLVIVPQTTPSAGQRIRRDESSSHVFFSGKRRDLVEAGIAKHAWFEDGTRQRLRRGKPIMIRKRRLVENGRQIQTQTFKNSDFVQVWIDRTPEEGEAYERRKDDMARLKDKEERFRRNADEQARESAKTPAEWKEPFLRMYVATAGTILQQLGSGAVKRIAEKDHKRLTQLYESFYEVLRGAEVVVNQPRILPRIRIVASDGVTA